MKFSWDVDESTQIEVTLGAFGTKIVSVNGRQVVAPGGTRLKREVSFQLPDGRAGLVSVKPQLLGRQDVELRVDGRLRAESTKQPIKCASCGATARAFDCFCDGCGKPLPSPEERIQLKRVQRATNGMRTLAVLFAIYGVVMFFATQSQTSTALAQLASLDGKAMLPLNGVTHSVAEWRDQIRWEPWGVLATNFVLAAVMACLALWGKRSPLPAVLIATATYMTVLVFNAILDPQTIAQGIFVKIVIIGFFVKGIKAALVLRTLRATDAGSTSNA